MRRLHFHLFGNARARAQISSTMTVLGWGLNGGMGIWSASRESRGRDGIMMAEICSYYPYSTFKLFHYVVPKSSERWTRTELEHSRTITMEELHNHHWRLEARDIVEYFS